MTTLYGGVRPRPRVLVAGKWSDDEIASLRERFASLVVVASNHHSDEHPEEVDLFVGGHSVGEGFYAKYRRAHVIAFGIVAITPYEAFFLTTAMRREFALPQISPRLHALRMRWLPEAADARGLPVVRSATVDFGSEDELRAGALALSAAPPGPLATVTWRAKADRGLAVIPTADDRVAWIDAIVAEWLDRDRNAFADIPLWREQSAWLTAAERNAQLALADLECRRASALAAFAAEAASLEHALGEARAKAESGVRRLLTTQSNDLVATVADVLQLIGFTVEPGDRPDEKKRQDLTVRYDDFVAIVEVKGYERSSAKGADLTQLERHRTAFIRQEPEANPAAWLVVNGQFALPPDARQLPFASDPEQIVHAAEGDTLIVPTTALYRAFRDEDRDALRARLMAARGLFGMAS